MVKVNILVGTIKVDICEKRRVASLKIDRVTLLANDIQNVLTIRQQDENCCKALLTVNNLLASVGSPADD